MIFAAGLGTRLKPITDTMPKAMVPVNGHPLLELTIHKLISAGASEIVINVHHFSEQIIDYVQSHQPWAIPITISNESDRLLDTGGGLFKASGLFTPDDSPILIHNVDILSNAELNTFYQHHVRSGSQALLLVSQRQSSRYLLFDDQMHLKGWMNEQTGQIKSPFTDLDPTTCHKFAFSGIHSFSPALFSEIGNFGDKFSIIDFYLSICDHVQIEGYIQPGLQMLDVGKLNTLQAAEEWMQNNP